jgi:hypothetical protein
LLLLALIAVTTLTPMYALGAQDVSRVCLTRALLHLEVRADSCLGTNFDEASYGGHLYSDKAPGMSVIEIPGVAVTRLDSAQHWRGVTLSLWLVRVLASGISFLLCAFMVGRVSEGLARGYGGVSLATFALGTLFAPLAAQNFEHVTAGTFGLAAFLLAWDRRPLLAGLAAGAAFLVAYEAALIVLIVGLYVALQGTRALAAYVRGALPGVLLLFGYTWVAFGRPWHLSYRYVAGTEAKDQASGLFGIHLPYVHAIREVFVGSGGLLVVSPVVLAAGFGIVLLGRRNGCRAEAVVCAAVTVAFLFLNCGYYLPYGGISPGPRFLVPCLPFLALGLAPAFAARFRVTAILAALSVIAMTGVVLTWVDLAPDPGTIWNQLVHFPVDRSQLFGHLSLNVLGHAGVSPRMAAALQALAAATAFAVALAATFQRRKPRLSGS